MPFSIESALDKYIEALEEPRPPDGYWHPSSISGCERAAVYDIRGTEKSDPLSLKAKRIFHVGKKHHEDVQAAIAADPEVVAFYPEVAILDEKLNVKGNSDGLVGLCAPPWDAIYEQLLSSETDLFSIDEITWIGLELKSINSMAFKYGDLPKSQHVMQLIVYLKALRDNGGIGYDRDGQSVVIPPLGDRLSKGRIVYVSKDDLKIEECTVLYTEAKEAQIIERLESLESHWSAGTLPPRLLLDAKGKRAWQCGYCPWQTLCWSDAKENT